MWKLLSKEKPPIGEDVLVSDGQVVTVAHHDGAFSVGDDKYSWDPPGISGYEWEWNYWDCQWLYWMPLPSPPSGVSLEQDELRLEACGLFSCMLPKGHQGSCAIWEP